MTFSELPDTVLKNAHYLYAVQGNKDAELKVDKQGNFHFVGFWGKIGATFADFFTKGAFSSNRALEVQHIAKITLEKLNNHLDKVRASIIIGRLDNDHAKKIIEKIGYLCDINVDSIEQLHKAPNQDEGMPLNVLNAYVTHKSIDIAKKVGMINEYILIKKEQEADSKINKWERDQVMDTLGQP